jgi:hypothetical protein
MCILRRGVLRICSCFFSGYCPAIDFWGVIMSIDGARVAAIIGALIATALFAAVLHFQRQAPGMTYCTAGMVTCITNSSGQWQVLSAMCPAGRSLQFISVDASRCHSITPAGFSAPLSVCPTTCAK